MKEERFKLKLLKEAREFLHSLEKDVRKKIGENIRAVQSGVTNPDLFSKMPGTNNIWEFRTLYEGTKYRLFSFWDKEIETFVIATHGIIKKDQKTPKNEISKAEKIKKEYFENKNKK